MRFRAADVAVIEACRIDSFGDDGIARADTQKHRMGGGKRMVVGRGDDAVGFRERG